MKNTILSLLSIVIFLVNCTAPEKTNHLEPKTIPMEDFFKNPQVGSYLISPNGQYLAFLKPYKKRMNIFVQDADQTKPARRITHQLDRDINTFFWKGNETILFLRDFGGDENFHIFKASINGTDEKDLTPFKKTKSKIIDDLADIDPTHILIDLNKRDKKVFDAYRLNIKTGHIKMIAKNPGNFAQWFTDHNGQLRMALSSDGANTSLYHRDSEKEDFKRVLTTNFKDALSPIFFTFDNKNIYALSNLNRDKAAIVIFDPKTGKETEVIYKRTDVDVRGLNYSKKRKILTNARYITWKSYYKFFDDWSEDLYKDLSIKLPGLEIYLPSVDKEERLAVVRTHSDKTRGAYYLYNTVSKELKKLADISPWIKPSEMADMKPIQYKSRDGLTINGYLTLPNNKNNKNLPTVVLPHGGPWARDVWRYSSSVQFLANRGYAVLQVNFRGSTGYGKKFWSSSFKKWGKEMQNDISDGVRYLISEGITDKNRVGIYGASYGGYAVLAGLTFTPDIYACGIDYVGISNIFTFINTIPPYWKPYLKMIYEMIGHPKKDKALLTQISPIFHVDKIKAPLMVVQGANDPRVKKSESDQIVDALRKRKIDVTYIVKDNEGHGFRNEENRLELYSKIEMFLEQHLLRN